MTKLKSAEEIESYIKGLIKDISCMGTYGLVELALRDYKKAIQIDTIQATVEMCAEEATLLEDGVDIGKEYFMEKYNTFYSDSVFSVNTQSILNVADKMKLLL